jgi:NFU1 iron-sulfur cluster scaffold homolog, mitochondrial
MSSPVMPEDVKIRGEFTPDPNLCRFVINRTLLESGWTLVFRSAEEAAGSPLIEAIFRDGAISVVSVQDSAITLTKNSPDHWPRVAQRLLPLMKEHLTKGPAVAPEVVERLKAKPVGERMAAVIQDIFERQINPALASHGGWVKLVEIRDRDVIVEMGGGCQGCSASKQTLKYGIEAAIREACPQVREILDVTDHASGANPYYKN